MSKREWLEVVALMTANWPHSHIPDASMAKWYSDLESLDGAKVKVAMEAIYRDGAQFPPNGAQILAKISELSRDDPDHGEAWRLAKKASLKADPKESFAWLLERSPTAAEAVRRMCGPCLTYQLDQESTVRAQFRDYYKAVVAERRRDDAYLGLPSAGLRGLERGPRKLGDALQRALPPGTDRRVG